MSQYRRNSELTKAVAKRFRELRKDLGKSQIDVYIDTDINMSRVEGGKTTITLNTIAILCDYYKISVKDFFNTLEI